MRRRSRVAHPAALPVQADHRSFTTIALLAVILLVAAALRLPSLTQAPPGLNQDEAANAWNAWCLLKTGQDQVGVRWPLSYFHALGENRTTLYLYLLIPVQALGGLNVWTTRLPAVTGGILTVFLIYWIAAQLFDRRVALVAAALLALNPWHIQLSRFGHEASVGPLLTAVALAALIWAGFPLGMRPALPRPWKALIAGLLTGICCYGYPAARLFIPPFLFCCALLNCRGWWDMLRRRSDALALGGLVIGLGATFGPLAYEHLAHPDLISKRGESVRLWTDADTTGQRIAKVAVRYAGHFGPDFLFVHGDHHEIQWAQVSGAYHWYALPLMLAGLWPTLRHVRRSRSARVLLCWLVLYPLGDSFYRGSFYQAPDGSRQMSLHALRSAPGLGAPILLAAVGAVTIHHWMWRRKRAALTVYGVFAVVVALLNVRFLEYYFVKHPRQPTVQLSFQPDLVAAAEWLKPRLAATDAVFVTTTRMNMPYVVMLVVLGYDARQWFRDERVVREVDGWDRYYRVGKLHFMFSEAGSADLNALQQNGRTDRVIFVVRPGETRETGPPAQTIYGPDGKPVLLLYETEL